MAEESDVCYICLEGSDKGEIQSCSSNCFAKAHRECLSRWQLHRAGKAEETSCRFCNQPLPAWRELYESKAPVSKISMVILFNGKSTRIRVSPGPKGEMEFKRVVMELHGRSSISETDLDVSFQFKAPDSTSGEKMTLVGMSAFGAAVHCAALTKEPKKKRELSRLFRFNSSGRGLHRSLQDERRVREELTVAHRENSAALQPREAGGGWGHFLQRLLVSFTHSLRI
eukprot:gene1207-32549_t